jgi:hypothetical protein
MHVARLGEDDQRVGQGPLIHLHHGSAISSERMLGLDYSYRCLIELTAGAARGVPAAPSCERSVCCCRRTRATRRDAGTRSGRISFATNLAPTVRMSWTGETVPAEHSDRRDGNWRFRKSEAVEDWHTFLGGTLAALRNFAHSPNSAR